MTPTVTLPDGETLPALGQGTWRMGEDPARRAAEIAALRAGIELGLTVLDTAEMYGEGSAETVVREAVAGRRDEVFIVSKAYPQNASRSRLPLACEASLKRLGTDRIDLYLLHWRGGVPLAETVEAMEALRDAGRIRHWGVSNLDPDDMEELFAVGGGACATDQVLYNLSRRGPELDLFPLLAARGVPVMAYSPIEQGRILGTPALDRVAGKHGVTPAQVALAWVLRRPGTMAIPKASNPDHVRQNAEAAAIRLDADDLGALDAAFPAPAHPVPLEVI